MKTGIIAFVMASLVSVTALGDDVYVQGYTKRDGTYVEGHRRTRENDTRDDNYSTRGNTNPYTGREGTKPRDYQRSYGR